MESLEIEYVRFDKKPIFQKKYDTSLYYIDLNKDKIKKAYDEMIVEIESDRTKRCQETKISENCSKTLICACGLPMIWVGGTFEFYGCQDYKNKSSFHASFPHKNWISKYEEIYEVRVDWVTYLIKNIELYGKIKAKKLFEWMIENGYQDLCDRFGRVEQKKDYNTYVKANVKSKEQELLAKKMLESTFDKVLYQQCITYKFVGSENLEKFCIPDFICSNKNEVVICDCKLSFSDGIIEKMNLYKILVKFFMLKNNDNRKLFYYFIIYDDYDKICYEELKIPFIILNK